MKLCIFEKIWKDFYFQPKILIAHIFPFRLCCSRRVLTFMLQLKLISNIIYFATYILGLWNKQFLFFVSPMCLLWYKNIEICRNICCYNSSTYNTNSCYRIIVSWTILLEQNNVVLYRQLFYKQYQDKIGKKSSKC